jgi:hypothetical protein
LYFTVSLAGTITFVTLIVAAFPIILHPKTIEIDLMQQGKFWCLVGFTLLAAGNISDYCYHYLVIFKGYQCPPIHQYTLAIPYIFSDIAFLIAMEVETSHAR